jgi:hypothetical protein
MTAPPSGLGPSDYRLYYDTGWTMPDRTDWVRYTCLATSVDGVRVARATLSSGPKLTSNGSKSSV